VQTQEKQYKPFYNNFEAPEAQGVKGIAKREKVSVLMSLNCHSRVFESLGKDICQLSIYIVY